MNCENIYNNFEMVMVKQLFLLFWNVSLKILRIKIHSGTFQTTLETSLSLSSSQWGQLFSLSSVTWVEIISGHIIMFPVQAVGETADIYVEKKTTGGY